MVDLYYIEDDPNIASAVKEYLEQKNFKVTICMTLAQAKQILNESVPTLVLLDWNMPDGHGDGLCQWIRSNWKELPIIFLTVRGDGADIVSGFRNGADDYVVKPFELEVLHSRILALLRRTGNVAEQYLSCDGIVIDKNRHVVSCRSEEITLSKCQQPHPRGCDFRLYGGDEQGHYVCRGAYPHHFRFHGSYGRRGFP